MKKTWSAALVLCGICGLMLVGSVLSGCGSGSGATTSSTATRDVPPELFGMWQLVRTSGGITGSGYPVTPGMETLTFNSNGTFFRTVQGEATQGTYQVTRRKTLFSESDLPVVTYSTATETDVISQVGDQPLVLSEEAADGFVREYERVITTNK